MKLFAAVALSMFLLVASANTEDNATLKQISTISIEKNSTDSNSSTSIVKGIKEVQNLKKDTFESTDQFTQRRNKKISELNNRVAISAKKVQPTTVPALQV